jgi:hypothetical protein
MVERTYSFNGVIYPDRKSMNEAADKYFAEADNIETQKPASTPLTDSEQKNLGINPSQADVSKSDNAVAERTGVTQSTSSTDSTLALLKDSLKDAPKEDPSRTIEPREEATNTTTDATVEVGDNKQKINIVGISNPLHDLPSYTYNVSLHVLSQDHYKETMQTGQYIPNESVLIGGAGRYNSQFQRAGPFKDVDFYINDLKMTSIIGANQKSQNSNVITMSFTIIEPNGATLMNRIVDTAQFIKTKFKYKHEPNHLDLPYLLEIEFVGYDENGIPLPARSYQFTKYIPIKIIGMKIKVSSKGAEYKCDCVPYNHHGMSNTVATVGVNINVTASTVGNFFTSVSNPDNVNNLVTGVNKAKDTHRTETENAKKITDEKGRAKSLADADTKYKNTEYPASSYTDAINAAYMLAKDYHNYKEFDNIEFAIDAEIAKSSLMETVEVASVNNTPANKDGSSAAKPANLDKKQVAINVNAGTNLLQVIETVILGSKYIRDQVVDPANSDDTARFKKMLEEKKKLNWFRVIPEIILKEFDPIRNEYSKTYKYHIVTWPITNNLIKYANNGVPDIVQKSYNYIFTGENNDILDFQIDFDTLYYVSTTLVREQLKKDQIQQKEAETTTSEDSPDEGSKDNKSMTTALVADRQGKRTRPDPHREISRATATNITAGAIGPKDPKTAIVYDTRNALMSGSRGDMVNVKLKIIGDPHFIKQDDFFYPPHKRSEFTPRPEIDAKFTPNGSLVTDSGELYAFLNFKTPVDFSDTTGLLDYDSEYIESPFKGFFKIIMVESSFTGGKFEQTLDLIRLPDQEEKLKEVAESQRTETAKPSTKDGRASDLSLPSPEIPNAKGVNELSTGESGDESLSKLSSEAFSGAGAPGKLPSNTGIFSNQTPQPTPADAAEAAEINRANNTPPGHPNETTPSQVASNAQINVSIGKSLGIPPGGKAQDPFAKNLL